MLYRHMFITGCIFADLFAREVLYAGSVGTFVSGDPVGVSAIRFNRVNT